MIIHFLNIKKDRKVLTLFFDILVAQKLFSVINGNNIILLSGVICVFFVTIFPNVMLPSCGIRMIKLEDLISS